MRQSRSTRLDYKVFDSAGIKIAKEMFEEEIDQKESIQNLITTSATIQGDIIDFIDENALDDLSTIPELTDAISKVESLRTSYRHINIRLQSLSGKSNEDFQSCMESLKQYIKGMKEKIRTIKSSEMHTSSSAKSKAIKFTIKELDNHIRQLESELAINLSAATDYQVTNAKKGISELNKLMEKTSTKLTKLIQDTTGTEYETEVKEKCQRYENIITCKRLYLKELETQLTDRELDKHSTFKDSILNIKIQKFGGFSSKTDIYTFKDQFDKLHMRSTPKSYLPDILRNNYLVEPALSLVKGETDIDQIWKTLTMAYGDTRILLSNKLSELHNIDYIYKIRDKGKVAENLSKIISVMKDLINLSKKHNLESKLFNSDGINNIYKLVGDSIMTRWLDSICDENVDGEELWYKFIKFLEREFRINQQKQLINQCQRENHVPDKSKQQRVMHAATHQVSDSFSKSNMCHFCEATDHVQTEGPQGIKIIQYFACKKFVDMKPSDRFLELKKKNLCHQCLFPGADASTGKHREGKCQRDFICPDESHLKYPIKKHVLVCDQHKSSERNKELLHQYKARCILKRSNLPSFSRDITNYHSNQSFKSDVSHVEDSESHSGIYQFQQIEVNCKRYLIFFDSGCSDFVVTNQATKQLGELAELRYKGPISIGGVGGVSTETYHGIYSVQLPIFDGSHVVLTGLAMDQITSTFPMYPIGGQVQDDIHKAYKLNGGDPTNLPKLPSAVGGNVDFMIGIKYLRYHPKEVYQLPSGLTIYQSMFKSPDGSRGVIGGPHQVFSEIQRQYHGDGKKTFLSYQLKTFQFGFQVNPDVPLLCFKNTINDVINESTPQSYVKLETKFNIAENAGSEVTYRCNKCRACNDCKTNDSIQITSIREEVEQDLINKSVTIYPEKQLTIATLPFTHDPIKHLQPNRHKALKVYKQQVKKLNQHPQDKDDVIKSEMKLQNLGHVDYIKNLPSYIQNQLQSTCVQNFIPWRAVWKLSSTTTPCRLVFDASQPTDSGYSLNSVLAKGTNGMNKLVEILLRWFTHKVGFHTDVTKMYNSIKLQEDQWCYQRYLWNENLDPNQEPEEKVIKTLIYGVKSSGNQSERGIRLTSALSKASFPEVDNIINNDTYVDDCITGTDSLETAMKRADQMESVLRKGGFGLKGFTFSFKDPQESLSKDGESIGVAGFVWYPKNDEVSIDVSELNFAKKQRGKKPTSCIGIIPSKITRRQCVSKVSELFDLTGKITPITAAFKLDLHNLVQYRLGWDDVIPENLHQLWQSNFETMQEIKHIRYARTIIPADAANLQINTVDFGDASRSMAAVAIYARLLRKNGEYSSQLIFSRSKIISPEVTQPRAELIAAVLNSHTGEVVKRALKSKYESSLKLTDSTIILHWINNEDISLKQYVRNRIIEIKRFTQPEDWRYISTNHMLADIATRKGAKIADIDRNSRWINGESWMRLSTDDFPTKTVSQIILNSSDLSEVRNEANLQFHQQEVYFSSNANPSTIPTEVQQRYLFSKYLIDPNRFSFQKVIRILGLVINFVSKLRSLVSTKSSKTDDVSTHTNQTKIHPSTILQESDINAAERYFWLKGTNEVEHFVKPEKYQHSTKVNGVLIFNGRILPSDGVNIISAMTKIMKDLHDTVFCVPIIDKHSPIAYAIMNDVHWNNKVVRHSGVESTLRYAMKIAYIIEGREVAKRVARSCKLCRILKKQRIKVGMGKIPSFCTTIAPAFYFTQADLAGPFQAYSNHNKRKSIKIWLVVFCCNTTSTTAIKVMDDYSTPAFLMSFTRFACESGYPKKLFIDQGSQVVKGCQDARINFKDLQHRLHVDVSVDFEICPVGGHNFNGKVERKIKEVKLSIEKSFSLQRLSLLQWETLASEVANSINDLPLALRGIVSDFETLDLITPNRLKLGRNNERSPVGTMTVCKNYSKIIQTNNEIYNAWFDCWLINHVPKIAHQPKWFEQDRDITVGDVVLFLKNDSTLCNTYHYGIVREVFVGRDSRIRKVKLAYMNHNESSTRETVRAVRELIVIHQVDEEDVSESLNSMYIATK